MSLLEYKPDSEGIKTLLLGKKLNRELQIILSIISPKTSSNFSSMFCLLLYVHELY